MAFDNKYKNKKQPAKKPAKRQEIVAQYSKTVQSSENPDIKIKKPGIIIPFNSSVWDDKMSGLAFALDCPEIKWSTLGQLANDHNWSLDYNIKTHGSSVLMEHDGFIPVSKEEALSGKFHVVACIELDTIGRDICLLRQEENGVWSYKQGEQAPTQKDKNGKLITNPENAMLLKSADEEGISELSQYARQSWTQDFIGYYKVPKEGIKYNANSGARPKNGIIVIEQHRPN